LRYVGIYSKGEPNLVAFSALESASTTLNVPMKRMKIKERFG